MPKIRVVLADDHVVLRQGLAEFINRQVDMEVVGQAADGVEAVEKTLELGPDVLLIDLAMPRCGGIQAMERIHLELPNVALLVLSMYEDQETLRSVLAAGAAGYVTKRVASEELLTAIRQVARGSSYVSIPLVDRGLKGVVREPAQGAPGELARLSPRERSVLSMVARGYTSKEIADRLGVSKGSVDSYRVRISDKLKVKNRAALVRLAVDMGLVGSGSEGLDTA